MEPERARVSQREPDSEPERARESQSEPEQVRESQRESVWLSVAPSGSPKLSLALSDFL